MFILELGHHKKEENMIQFGLENIITLMELDAKTFLMCKKINLFIKI